MMVAFFTMFYFFRILFWLAMYHNFFSMLQSTGDFNHWTGHYVQKKFCKQYSICRHYQLCNEFSDLEARTVYCWFIVGSLLRSWRRWGSRCYDCFWWRRTSTCFSDSRQCFAQVSRTILSLVGTNKVFLTYDRRIFKVGIPKAHLCRISFLMKKVLILTVKCTCQNTYLAT